MEEKEKRRSRRVSISGLFFKTDSPFAVPKTDDSKKPSSPASFAGEDQASKRKSRGLSRLFQKSPKGLNSSTASTSQMYMLAEKEEEASQTGTASSIGRATNESGFMSFLRAKKKYTSDTNLFNAIKEKRHSGISQLKRTKTDESQDQKWTPAHAFVQQNPQLNLANLSTVMVTNFEANVQYAGHSFLALVIVDSHGLQISSSMQTVEEYGLVVPFSSITELVEDSRTILTVHMGKDGEEKLIMSTFNVDFITAYYSVLVPLNRSRNFFTGLIDSASENSDTGTDECACGHEHQGKQIVMAEVTGGIPPENVLENLFLSGSGPYSIWNISTDRVEIGCCGVDPTKKRLMIPEPFGDLEEKHSFEVKQNMLISSPDHFVYSVRLQSAVRSFNSLLTMRMTVCVVRPDPTSSSVQLCLFLDTEPTEFVQLDQVVREIVVPAIQEWAEKAVETFIMAIPSDTDDDQYGLVEDCPTCSSIAKSTFFVLMMPCLHETLIKMTRHRILRYKEAILALFILIVSAIVSTKAIHRVYFTEKTESEGANTPEGKYLQYKESWKWRHQKLKDQFNAKVVGIKHRLEKL